MKKKFNKWIDLFLRSKKYQISLLIGMLVIIIGLFLVLTSNEHESSIASDMQVKHQDKNLDSPILTLSPRAQKLAEIESSEVTRMPVTIQTSMYGKIDYDEELISYVAAWMPGRIDRLYIDYLGEVVSHLQPMAEIYSPELITAQAELFEARKVLNRLEKSEYDLVTISSQKVELAAREKLRLLGIDDQQIDEIIERGTPKEHVTLRAPIPGTVIDLNVREGIYVNTGTRLFTIADLSRVWLFCEAFETDLTWIWEGLEVQFRIETYPGEIFKGRISYIDPFINEKTRTARVRIEVPNLYGYLKPGMFVSAIQGQMISTPLPLVIPLSAPLLTGKRAVVYVVKPNEKGVYEGREIVLGPKTENGYIVKQGLKEGEKVVTKGNFLIDSAMQISAKPSMMDPKDNKMLLEDSGPQELSQNERGYIE